MSRERSRANKTAATAAMREQRQRQRHTRLVRRAVVGVVLTAVAAAAGYSMVSDRRFNASIVTGQYPAGQHESGPLRYRESPPFGGTHNVVWQNCGIYTVPLHNEHAVHALEHGAIWITYRPDLAAADIQHLQTVASDDYMLLSPYSGLPAPVVASAWNRQIQLTGANDARLPQFVRRYKNNADTTPEFGASCLGGTSATAQTDSLNTGGSSMQR